MCSCGCVEGTTRRRTPEVEGRHDVVDIQSDHITIVVKQSSDYCIGRMNELITVPRRGTSKQAGRKQHASVLSEKSGRRSYAPSLLLCVVLNAAMHLFLVPPAMSCSLLSSSRPLSSVLVCKHTLTTRLAKECDHVTSFSMRWARACYA